MKIQKRKGEITIEDVFKEFIWFKQYEEELSKETITVYKYHIGSFLKRVGADTPATEITHREYIDFTVDMQDNVKNPRTRNSYYRSVRVFLYWAMDENYVKRFDIKINKVQESVKIPYSDDDIAALLKKPDLKASFVENRTWIYCCICITTGLRLRSVLNIRVADIDFNSRKIAITATKNKRAYLCPISLELATYLKAYINRYKLMRNDYLICKDNGLQLSKKATQDALVRYNHSRGVLATSSHLFRHTYAYNFMENGGNIVALKDHLQHQSLKTTQEYVCKIGADNRDNGEIYNPLKQNRKIV